MVYLEGHSMSFLRSLLLSFSLGSVCYEGGESRELFGISITISFSLYLPPNLISLLNSHHLYLLVSPSILIFLSPYLSVSPSFPSPCLPISISISLPSLLTSPSPSLSPSPQLCLEADPRLFVCAAEKLQLLLTERCPLRQGNALAQINDYLNASGQQWN